MRTVYFLVSYCHCERPTGARQSECRVNSGLLHQSVRVLVRNDVGITMITALAADNQKNGIYLPYNSGKLYKNE